MRQAEYTCIATCDKNVMYPIYEDREICSKISETLGYDLSRIVDTKEGKVTTVYTLGKYDFDCIYFVGMGKSEEITTRKMRNIFAGAVKELKAPIVFIAKVAATEAIDVQKVAALFTESYMLASYKERVIGHDIEVVEEAEVLVPGEDVSAAIEKAVQYAAGINNARRVSDTPSNMMTPAHLVEEAKKLAEEFGMECEIFDKAALEEMGAGGLLAVNQGSTVPAYMICLKYTGGEGPYKAVVGKGLTFDSGGYNLKSSPLGMKYDMCGGADVLGVMQILAATKAKVNVYGIIPTTENLISGSACKPGDVVTTLSGKTVEIINTDAEGRMILCDALTYAQKLGATHIVDFATLTGACVKALGATYTGVFANDDAFYQDFAEALERSDEKGWRLPIDEEYFELLKSSSADMMNCSMSGLAGASVAANFLNAFVEEGTKWIHLDVAGTANDRTKGASGAMIRSVVEVLCK